MEELTSWINSKEPDIVALQELCGYTEQKLLEDAKKWGHKYAIILKTGGYPVGLTSSKPIVLKEKVMDDLWHGMLHCKTWGIDIFVAGSNYPPQGTPAQIERGSQGFKIKRPISNLFSIKDRG